MTPLANFLHQKGVSIRAPVLLGHEGDVSGLASVTAAAWLGQIEAEVQTLSAIAPKRPLFIIGQSFGAILSLYAGAVSTTPIAGIVIAAPPLRLKSLFQEIFFGVLSAMPDAALNRLGSIAKEPRPNGYLSLPYDSYADHSIAALARLLQIRRKVRSLRDKISCPVLAMQDPDDHHLAPHSIGFTSAYVISEKIETEYFRGGRHELLLGPCYLEVYQRILRFLEERS